MRTGGRLRFRQVRGGGRRGRASSSVLTRAKGRQSQGKAPQGPRVFMISSVTSKILLPSPHLSSRHPRQSCGQPNFSLKAHNHFASRLSLSSSHEVCHSLCSSQSCACAYTQTANASLSPSCTSPAMSSRFLVIIANGLQLTGAAAAAAAPSLTLRASWRARLTVVRGRKRLRRLEESAAALRRRPRTGRRVMRGT